MVDEQITIMGVGSLKERKRDWGGRVNNQKYPIKKRKQTHFGYISFRVMTP